MPYSNLNPNDYPGGGILGKTVDNSFCKDRISLLPLSKPNQYSLHFHVTDEKPPA